MAIAPKQSKGNKMKEYLDKAPKKDVVYTVRMDKALKEKMQKKIAALKKSLDIKVTAGWFISSAIENFLKELDHL